PAAYANYTREQRGRATRAPLPITFLFPTGREIGSIVLRHHTHRRGGGADNVHGIGVPPDDRRVRHLEHRGHGPRGVEVELEGRAGGRVGGDLDVSRSRVACQARDLLAEVDVDVERREVCGDVGEAQ